MNEKRERQLRRKALRWLAQGWPPGKILARLGRSRQWLSKWRRRFRPGQSASLRSRGRRPQRSPTRLTPWVKQLVIATRRDLAQRAVGLIGPKAIQRELAGLCPVGLTSIKRILRQAGITGGRPSPPPYFPQPQPPEGYQLDATDWTERYLPGGAKVYAFHTLDLRTRAGKQTISPNKSGATVRAHALTVWKSLGIPDFLQLDNDAAFNGGYKVPRVIGQFVRLCLSVGVELIFLPVGEAERNGAIESFNHLWGGSLYDRSHFDRVEQVAATTPAFEAWYMHVYAPPKLNGRTPGQAGRQVCRPRLSVAAEHAIPEPLPITAGRLHFIRQVSADGTIRLLNETWRVGKRWTGKYVWATVTTQRHTLSIYYRAKSGQAMRCLRHFPFPLSEPVRPLLPLFRQHRRLPVSSMS